MMRAVGRGKEGWLGLWKGSLTSFIYELTSSTIQPIVSSILSVFAPAALSPLPLAYAPYPYKTLGLLLSSHLITGVLVSPLDLVRTRLIAQSTLPAHRKYSGPYDAMKKTLREEGGWKTAYLHPNLLIPTILDFTIRPLLSLGAPLLIEHTLRLEPTHIRSVTLSPNLPSRPLRSASHSRSRLSDEGFNFRSAKVPAARTPKRALLARSPAQSAATATADSAVARRHLSHSRQCRRAWLAYLR